MKFQSLIGRLGTLVHRSSLSLQVLFQSLIGRLGTHVANLRIFHTVSTFQSLIGRLGTIVLPPHHRMEENVSIPHR